MKELIQNHRFETALTICTALLFLFLGVMYCNSHRKMEMDGSFQFSEGDVGERVVYQGIRLGPGVYRVGLEYETNADGKAYCTIKDGAEKEHRLLVNHEHLYQYLGGTDFRIWLFGKADDLQVVVHYDGESDLTIGKLTITQTGQAWTMGMGLLFFFWVIALWGTGVYKKSRQGRFSGEKMASFLWLSGIVFVASIPYLCGQTYFGGDLVYHLQRIEGVKDGLLMGQIPVRLEPRWLFDHGYANGIFYCNVFLLFPAILRILGFPVYFSYHCYCIAVNAATAWVSYSCFVRIFRKNGIACLCSGVYTLSIYRIYKLVFVSAVGEGTALLFLPLLLYGLYAIFEESMDAEEGRKAWVPLAIGATGLLYSHVLSCEITVLVVLLYALLYARKFFTRRVLGQFGRAAAFSLLAGLWYLIPFADFYLSQNFHIKNVSARTIQEHGLLVGHLLVQFWKPGIHEPAEGFGLQDSHPVGLGAILILYAVVFLGLWCLKREKENDGRCAFAKRTFLIGIVMMIMSLRIFPWNGIQRIHPLLASLVSSLQFPYRFLGWGTLCLVMVMGYCLVCLERSNKLWYRGFACATALVLLASNLYFIHYLMQDDLWVKIYDHAGMGFGYVSGAEYVIEGTDHTAITFSGVVGRKGVEISQYRKKALGAEVVCRNATDETSYLTVPLMLYKGYHAVDEKTGRKLVIDYGPNKEVCVELPAGYDGTVKVFFAAPVHWRIAEAVSLLTIVWFLEKWKRNRQNMRRPEAEFDL